MSGPRRIALLAVALLLAAAPDALAAGDYCVGVVRDNCTPAATFEAALEEATQDLEPDRIFLGAGIHDDPATPATPFSDGNTPVSVIGLGTAQTTIRAGLNASRTLALLHPDSSLRDARVEAPEGGGGGSALELAGDALRVELDGQPALRFLPGSGTSSAGATEADLLGAVVAEGPAVLQRSTVDAPDGQGTAVLSTGTMLVLDSVSVLQRDSEAALTAECDATDDGSLLARHVTVTGSATFAARARCELTGVAAIDLRSSLLRSPSWDANPFVETGNATVTTAYSAHEPDSEVPDPPGRIPEAAPLVDAGDPQPLAPGEPFADLPGYPRVTDGDGDGTVRRDVGATELQPAAVPIPPGNVLANPGAEDGLSGWNGTFTAVDYGSDSALPGLRFGEALGGGQRFFYASSTAGAEMLQRIDVAGAAAAIDAGGATAGLSGLLGGYGADADAVTVEAIFRDPEGIIIEPRLKIGPVPPAERGNSTNLLFRAVAGTLPPRTRAVDVVVRGTYAGGGFTDAYADNLGLVLSVPGVPVPGPVDPGKPVVPGLKPFAGVSVLTGRTRVSRTGRARVSLACASATVGSCRGTLELRTRLPRKSKPSRIARLKSFAIAPGRRTRATLRLTIAARRALRRRTAINTRLVTVARDGQGVQRRRTVPLRLLLRRR